MFPTTSQIFNNYLPHLFAVSLTLVLGLGLLFRFIKGKNAEAREEGAAPANWAFIGVALLMASVITYFTVPPLVNAFRYRFNPQQIVEIRFIKLGDEKPGVEKHAPVVITDRALIAKGFQTLTTATGYSVNHEHFLPDGYGIDFKLEGSNDYSPMHLTAYRQTRRAGSNSVSDPVSIVSVNSYLNAADMNLNCPAFHSWLKKYVDPLFAPPPVNLP
ncbi:MAG: hypothetical protein ACKVZH_29095 [Blastocatellia bacterium]